MFRDPARRPPLCATRGLSGGAITLDQWSLDNPDRARRRAVLLPPDWAGPSSIAHRRPTLDGQCQPAAACQLLHSSRGRRDQPVSQISRLVRSPSGRRSDAGPRLAFPHRCPSTPPLPSPPHLSCCRSLALSRALPLPVPLGVRQRLRWQNGRGHVRSGLCRALGRARAASHARREGYVRSLLRCGRDGRRGSTSTGPQLSQPVRWVLITPRLHGPAIPAPTTRAGLRRAGQWPPTDRADPGEGRPRRALACNFSASPGLQPASQQRCSGELVAATCQCPAEAVRFQILGECADKGAWARFRPRLIGPSPLAARPAAAASRWARRAVASAVGLPHALALAPPTTR